MTTRFLIRVAALAAALSWGAPAGAAEMTFVGWSHTEVGLKPPLEKLFADFQAKSPGDTVQIIGFPFAQMEQNLILRQRTGQRTDVAQMQERWVPQFAAMNALADLDQVFGKEELAAVFDEQILALARIKGRQVG